jgi:predicted porin
MKKTIIAAAVAASFVAPVAMAEVSISGMVNPEYIDQQGTASWGASSINTDLVIKATEDLGNGMKATAKLHRFTDTTDEGFCSTASCATEANETGMAGSTADMSVAISGDFGTALFGRFEPASEGVMDAFMNIDASHDLDLEDNTNAIGRSNNGIAYTLPTMNGLSLTVGNFVGLDAGETDAATASENNDFSGATEVLAKYSNGGLTVMANSTKVDNGAKHQSLAVSYKMGDFEFRAMDRNTEDSSGTDSDSEFYGVKYTMGANTLAAGMLDETAANTDVAIYSASHALSKNTSVYVTVLDSDVADSDKTAFGIVQKF